MHSYLFPHSYSSWLSPRLPLAPQETLASCDRCAMVQPRGLTRDPGPFLNNLKCCTYFPYIPNFSLGALSLSQIHQALPRGILLPVGLFPSPQEQLVIETLGGHGFGQKKELLCPYFDSVKNQCSIWNYRPGVCTSYFCKSNYAQSGLDFWSDVEKYLNHFEWKLACQVFYKLGLSENELAYCQSAINPNTEAEELDYFLAAAWGPWKDQKQLFYQKCKLEAEKISSQDLNSILDPEFLELEKKINEFTNQVQPK